MKNRKINLGFIELSLSELFLTLFLIGTIVGSIIYSLS